MVLSIHITITYYIYIIFFRLTLDSLQEVTFYTVASGRQISKYTARCAWVRTVSLRVE